MELVGNGSEAQSDTRPAADFPVVSLLIHCSRRHLQCLCRFHAAEEIRCYFR